MLRIITCLVVVLSSRAAFGEDLSVSAYSNLRSKYFFQNGAKLYDDAVVQSGVSVSAKGGLTLDLWSSVPADLGEIGENYATELMLSVGWAGKLGDYNVSVGIEYEDLHDTLTFEGTDFVILVGELSRDFKLSPTVSVSPFVHIETNFTLDGTTMADTLPRLGTRFAWQVNDVLSLSGRAMAVYDPGILGGDAAWIGNIEASLSWKLGNNMTLELPFLRIVDPLTSVSDGREADFIWGMGISFKF